MKILPPLLLGAATAAVTYLATVTSLKRVPHDPAPAASIPAPTPASAPDGRRLEAFQKALFEANNETVSVLGELRDMERKAAAAKLEAEVQIAGLKNRLASEELAVEGKDLVIKVVEGQLNEARGKIERLEARPPVALAVVLPPPAPVIIADGEIPVSNGTVWQYPQPIDPTDWIQQTLTPPPHGANGAWDRIRGK